MHDTMTLGEYADTIRLTQSGKRDMLDVVTAVAGAITAISHRVSLGSLLGEMGTLAGINSTGEAQKAMDMHANDLLMQALAQAPVAEIVSEEAPDIVAIDPRAPLAVAFDPLDGSANIDTNMPIGTIFSIVPAGQPGEARLRSFGGPGTGQVAAGFALYGPQTMLVLTHGDGVDLFTLDRRDDQFRLVGRALQIPRDRREYAINVSNYRHWEKSVRIYIDDCNRGTDGVRQTDFNMRWMGCVVADALRILLSGGVYLYPADTRPGYEHGRLRLLYEAHPIAFVIEQAGGRATTGYQRILDMTASTPHQRVPLIFGCEEKVARIERMHHAPDVALDKAPLFATRGLFRS